MIDIVTQGACYGAAYLQGRTWLHGLYMVRYHTI